MSGRVLDELDHNGHPSSVTNGNHKLVTNGSAVQAANYFGHDREEVTRILIQALSDMGYQSAAEIVSKDSGYKLESPKVAAFRSAILAGSWSEAEQLLDSAMTPGPTSSEANGGSGEDAGGAGAGKGLVLAVGSDEQLMRFWIRQQKFLELLEQGDKSRALAVLRSELTPLSQDSSKLHFLSSLLMCRSIDDLMARAAWDGSKGESRKLLLSELSRCISPSVMLPEHRLAVLLQQVKQGQINACLHHTTASAPSLYADHICDRRHFPTEVALELPDLHGEVWQLQFSHDGSRLAACGSKETVIIWDTKTFEQVVTLAGHADGVGNLAWSPDDSMIVTCSQDKHARIWNAKTGDLIKKTERFDEPVIGCVWAADSQSFVVGTLGLSRSLCTVYVGEEETSDWNKKHRVQDLCGSPDGQWLVAVDDASVIHVYDGKTEDLVFELEFKSRPMSVSISEDSQHLLINKTDGEAQMINLATRDGVQKYVGHAADQYVIRSSFGGANESFVVSGSEDGNILIWHKNTGTSMERLPGHEPRCNAVVWNPVDPCMLASGGDDGIVKIWTNSARRSEVARHRGSNGWSGTD